MADIVLTGDTSGAITIAAPSVAGTNTLTLPASTGTLLTTTGDGSGLTGLPAPDELSTATGSAPSYSARAWVNFNGTGTVAIRDSGNVSSITDNGTGDYTINFTTAMPDANYSAVANCTTNNAYSVQFVSMFNSAVTNNNITPTTSGFRLSTRESSGAGRDEEYVIASVFR